MLSLFLIPSATASTPSSASTAAETLLMADDASIMYTAGLQRKLQPLARPTTGGSEALIKPDKPWEKLLAYNTVLKINGTYRMWYQSCDDSPSCVVCYATSKDGLNWAKPKLGLFAYGNVSATNIILQASAAEGPEAGLYYGDVLYDPLEKNISRRFKMVLFDLPLVPGVPHGSGRPGVPGMWLAFSADGIVWKRPNLSEGPALVAAYGGSPITQPPYEDQNCESFEYGPCGTGQQWIAPLAPSDVINLMRDPKTGEYKAIHKTW